MTDEQRSELATLAEAKQKASEARHNYGFINIAGRTSEELEEIARRGAELDAACVETTARYTTLLGMLGGQAEQETRAHYAHLVANV